MHLSRCLCLVLPVFLMGCETLGLSDSDPANQALGPICPASAVLSDAVSVTKLRPGTAPAPGGDMAPQNAPNVVLMAEMSQAQLTCHYDRENNRLAVDINFAVRATRGAAAGAGDPALDFFVAVLDADGNVITKRIFSNPPEMAGRQVNTFMQTVNDFAVPLARDTMPVQYEILTGFQLSQGELTYNRGRRAPRS